MKPLVRLVLLVGGAVVVLVASSLALDRTRVEIDLTQDRSLSLTKQTREVVSALRRDVKITAFVRREEGGRAEAAALMSRYQRLNPRISFAIKDPDDVPGEARAKNVDLIAGGVALQSGTRIEQAPAVSELELTSALARLQRQRRATVCFTEGHGERAIDDATDVGYRLMAKALRDNGYTVETSDLLTQTRVPDSCEAVIVAAPTAPLGGAEGALSDWLAAGGRLLLLADPASTVQLNPLVEPLGIHLERGIVLEGSDQARLPGDPVTPVVSRYRSGYPFVQRLAPTFFPGAQAVTVAKDPGTDGLTLSTFAQTSEASYLEREPASASFDPTADIPGPVGLAAAADRSQVQGTGVIRTRLAVIGDVDFASNAFVSEGGNGSLVVRIADWLTVQENLVAISPNIGRLRPLTLTEGRVRYALVLSAVVVPLFFLLAGAMVWAVRRPR